MSVHVERLDDGPALVRVGGPLDYPSTEELAAALSGLLAGGTRYVAVDLTDATPIDDAAVGVLYDALRRVRAAGGAVSLAVRDEGLDRVLSVMGLDRAFRIAANARDAVALVCPGGRADAQRAANALVDWPAEGR
jgi:anti-anti-sigma factor